MDLIKVLTNEQLKKDVPEVEVGNTVRVHNRIKEGNRERIQLFEGTVIAKNGGGISETFTVRRVSYGVGTEKTFPIHSPNVQSVEVVRAGKVRRAKLYYLRDRVGKKTRLEELRVERNEAEAKVVKTKKRGKKAAQARREAKKAAE